MYKKIVIGISFVVATVFSTATIGVNIDLFIHSSPPA